MNMNDYSACLCPRYWCKSAAALYPIAVFCVETIFLYSTISHQTQRNTDIDIYRTNFAERLGQRYQFFAVLVVFVRRKANPSQSFKLLLI